MKHNAFLKRMIMSSTAMFIAVFMLCIIFPSCAKAASRGSQDSQTIYVQTYSNWWKPGSSKITIKQSPVKVYYYKTTNHNRTKYKNLYGVYRISVYRDGKKILSNHRWNSKSFNCTMKPNCRYRIVVSYDSTSTWYHELSKAPLGYTLDGTRNRRFSWYVSSSNKVKYN